MLPRADLMVAIEAVPTLQLRNRHLKLMGYAEHRVALAHRVHEPAARHGAFVAIMPRARLDDEALPLHDRIAGAQIVEACKHADRYALSLRDLGQGIAGPHAVDDLAAFASRCIARGPVDACRRQ